MNDIGDACDISISINELDNRSISQIIAVYDLLGREVSLKTKGILIIHFENGNIEKWFNE